ncbi:MAG: hypothetical protein ACOVOT_12525 [Rubrivivax sp.]|jgi:hypothetical protein|nr:hypothetical protein [Rubrivivax sp.]
MSAVAPQVWSLQAFKSTTTPSSIFKRHRGKHLSRIDKALQRWNGGLGTRDTSISGLVLALKACRGWLQDKADSSSDTTTLRRTGVNQLADQLFARLQFETFEKRKAAAAHYTGSTQALVGGYQHERTTYLASGKTQALSGSTASALVGFADRMDIDLNGKTFNTLTAAEFKTLIETHAAKNLMETEVLFLNKQDRIGKLVMIEDGILYDGPDSKVDTGELDRGGHPYVIDAYGNMYSADHVEYGRNLPAHQRFNHSSFNAGKEVISAGIVQVVQGRLWSIDNNSGHYKPDRIQLINALMMLRDCGIDLNQVRVGLKEPSNQPGRLAFKYYSNAQYFLANPNMTPHETHIE